MRSSPSSFHSTGTYREYFAQLGLLFGGVGDDESACGAGLVLVLGLDHDAVAQRLQIHPTSSSSILSSRFLQLLKDSSLDNRVLADDIPDC